MARGGVSPVLFLQQLAAWALFALAAPGLRRVFAKVSPHVLGFLSLLLLALTLLGEPAGGARRWLDLGILNVNAAMLVLPALIAVLARVKSPFAMMLAAGIVLCVQPDAAQLCAFAAASLPLLWQHRQRRLLSAACAAALAVLAVLCGLIPVSLEPTAYCEGILSMLCAVSPLLAAVGVVSLAAIPAFFLVRFLRSRQTQFLALAAYYAVMMLFTLTGHDPIPFMGFGLSPIVGFFLASSLCGDR